MLTWTTHCWVNVSCILVFGIFVFDRTMESTQMSQDWLSIEVKVDMVEYTKVLHSGVVG